jgi:hypothetical protein
MTTLHFDIGRQTKSRKIRVHLSNLGTCAYRKSHPAKLGLLAEARGIRPAFAKRLRRGILARFAGEGWWARQGSNL